MTYEEKRRKANEKARRNKVSREGRSGVAGMRSRNNRGGSSAGSHSGSGSHSSAKSSKEPAVSETRESKGSVSGTRTRSQAPRSSSGRRRSEPFSPIEEKSYEHVAARSSRSSVGNILIALVALLAIMAVLVVWHPWTSVEPAQNNVAPVNTTPGSEGGTSVQPVNYTPQASDFSNIQTTGTDISGFNVSGQGDAPQINDASRSAINQALQPYKTAGTDVGFILMDLENGRGVAYNIDDKIYGASSFKGPYCAYMCSENIDEGAVGLGTKVRRVVETRSGGFTSSGSSNDSLRNLISDTIKYSDNAAYTSMRITYSDANLADWLDSIGADKSIAYDTSFPSYTVRDAARMWTATYDYLESDSSSADFLGGLFESTEVSFLRSGVDTDSYLMIEVASDAAGSDGVRMDADPTAIEHVDAEGDVVSADNDGGTTETVSVASASEAVSDAGGSVPTSEAAVTQAAADTSGSGEVAVEQAVSDTLQTRCQTIVQTANNMMRQLYAKDITVMNKAGWIASGKKKYNSMCDNGIITCNGHDYLMCVMTGASYSDANEANISKLVDAVFSTHEQLV